MRCRWSAEKSRLARSSIFIPVGKVVGGWRLKNSDFWPSTSMSDLDSDISDGGLYFPSIVRMKITGNVIILFHR